MFLFNLGETWEGYLDSKDYCVISIIWREPNSKNYAIC